MRAVLAGFNRLPTLIPITDGQVWDRVSGRQSVYSDTMSVRYDNGQLCTFKRKSPPQGGEG